MTRSIEVTFVKTFHLALRRATRLVSLRQAQAPKVIERGNVRLVAESIKSLWMCVMDFTQEEVKREIDQIKRSCPCFFCGHHQPKKDGEINMADPDTFEFTCLKGHELIEDYQQDIRDSGCPDFNPEGGILLQSHIAGEIKDVLARFSDPNVAQAFKVMGQAMVQLANKELAHGKSNVAKHG